MDIFQQRSNIEQGLKAMQCLIVKILILINEVRLANYFLMF